MLGPPAGGNITLITSPLRPPLPPPPVLPLQYLAGYRGPNAAWSAPKVARMNAPAGGGLSVPVSLFLGVEVARSSADTIITEATPLYCYYRGGEDYVPPPAPAPVPAPPPLEAAATVAVKRQRSDAGVSGRVEGGGEGGERWSHSRHAVCFTVMRGDAYVPGALVAAYSVRCATPAPPHTLA